MYAVGHDIAGGEGVFEGVAQVEPPGERLFHIGAAEGGDVVGQGDGLGRPSRSILLVDGLGEAEGAFVIGGNDQAAGPSQA